MEAVVVRGLSIEKNQAKVTVRGVPDQPGVAARVFIALAEASIIIDMIVQNVSKDGTTDISFTLNKDELPKIEASLSPVVKEIGAAGLETQGGIGKLSVIGIGMRSHSGVAAKMFEALAKAGINIVMISTSEIKTAVIVDEDKLAEGANVVHEAFGLSTPSKV
jgi:aspartate kinase